MRWCLLPFLLLLLACTPAEEIEPQPPDAARPDGAEVEPVRGSDGVEYRATTAVLESFPVQLHTTVEATNPGSTPVELTFADGCVALLRAYRAEDGSRPAWDQAGTTACTQALVTVTLATGERQRFETRASAAEILGDSLADGNYRLVAYVRPVGGAIEIPAGTVPLAAPRD